MISGLSVPKVRFEPDFYPYKQKKVPNYREGTAQYDAIRASPTIKVLTLSTGNIYTNIVRRFPRKRCDCHHSVTL